MNCNYKTVKALTCSERAKLEKELKKYSEKYLEEVFESKKVEFTNNIFKLFVVSSNTSCGIGKNRTLKIFYEINRLMEESEKDEIFWYHIDNQCKKILGDSTFNNFLGVNKNDK